MSVKSLAPIALGIGALYVFSTKGSPFEQPPREPGAKPGGEHVGPPKPEPKPTLKDLKKRDAGLRKLAGLTGEPYDDTDHINARDDYTLTPTPIQKAIKKADKQIAVYRPAVAPPPVKPKPPTPAAINDPKAAGFSKRRPADYLSTQTSQPTSQPADQPAWKGFGTGTPMRSKSER